MILKCKVCTFKLKINKCGYVLGQSRYLTVLFLCPVKSGKGQLFETPDNASQFLFVLSYLRYMFIVIKPKLKSDKEISILLYSLCVNSYFVFFSPALTACLRDLAGLIPTSKKRIQGKIVK